MSGVDVAGNSVAVIVEQLAGQVDELPTGPAVAARVIEVLTNNPNVTAPDVEAVIIHDPALVLKVLRLANSPPFGASGRISTMGHALARLDSHIAKLVSLSFNLKLSDSSESFDYDAYWRQSRAMAVAAAQLALYFPEVNLHEAQLAAVLSDVGQLLLADHFGDVYADALDDADRTRRTIHEVERERFGVDHARLASRVLRFWKIPAALADAIEAHCDPQAIEALDQHARELAKVVHLTAISVAYLISNAAHGFETIRQLTERWIKLDAEGCSVLLGMLVDPIERLDQMYAAVPLDPTEILAAARKLIVKESLATATSLVITARQAEETQAQIEKLQRHRERLEQQVTTDPLTGIGNRKHFEDQLRKELKRCMRSRQPLSLIMFDLDQFKRLNDTFGHPAGDEVLRSTTRAIRECLRASDDLSRYGGEEFMVIAPETDLRGAESLADRMREKLESTTATYGPHVLCITASFGVATISGHEISVSPEQLIQAADNCMYAAKRAGRNCVRAVSM